MTKKQLEELAVGIETGYTDRVGKPIKVGDSIVIYSCQKEYIGAERVRDEYMNCAYEYIVGYGYAGYVYTGKVRRSYHTVGFSFEDGLQMTSTGKYAFLYNKDKYGNLKTVLVASKDNAPKLTFEDLLKGGVDDDQP